MAATQEADARGSRTARSVVLTAALATLLAGCSLSPGMRMSHPVLQTSALPGWPADAGPEPTTLEINTRLLDSLTTRSESTPAMPAESGGPAVYHLGAGDVLGVTVWDHPELNIDRSRSDTQHAPEIGHVIGADGMVFFPYAGALNARGRTVEEFRKALAQALSRQLKDPQVSVQVSQFRSQRAYVGGEVKTPGALTLTDVPIRVADAVMQAGGGTELADLSHVELSRGGQLYKLDLRTFYANGRADLNPVLKDGDIINLPSAAAERIFVMGEVPRPGVQAVGDHHVSLTEALAAAGGLDQTTAAANRVYVIRGEGDQRIVYHLDARSAESLALADRFDLQPRDVVFVDAAGVTRWNRFVSQILPSATVLQRASYTDFPLFHGREREVHR